MNKINAGEIAKFTNKPLKEEADLFMDTHVDSNTKANLQEEPDVKGTRYVIVAFDGTDPGFIDSRALNRGVLNFLGQYFARCESQITIYFSYRDALDAAKEAAMRIGGSFYVCKLDETDYPNPIALVEKFVTKVYVTLISDFQNPNSFLNNWATRWPRKFIINTALSEESTELDELTESYRRIVSRGNSLVDNELFVDFE